MGGGVLRGQAYAPFDYWWQRHGEWVEAPNQRRGGESGVQRVRTEDGRLCYAKRQVGHVYRSLAYPFGRPTVLREAHALQAWASLGVRVPQIVFCGARHSADGPWHAMLVTEALGDFVDIEQWYAAGGREQHGEAFHQRFLEALGRVLARLHAARWQHGCLYNKHIFLRSVERGGEAGVEVALIDLEKSRRRWSRKKAMDHDFGQLKRHSSWKEADWQHLLYGYQSP